MRKKYLEEQDKRKSLQNLRNEMDMRTSYLRDSVEQKKKQLIEELTKFGMSQEDIASLM